MPYFVLATQNPIEQEGTYPLPEAQLDRFMLNLTLTYPTFEEEINIVRNTTSNVKVQTNKLINSQEILSLQFSNQPFHRPKKIENTPKR